MTIILVKGRVQGVAFRFFTKKKADELSIIGSVQNLGDGSVLIKADGNKLSKFIEWCKKGPKTARVESVTIKEQNENTKSKNCFIILR